MAFKIEHAPGTLFRALKGFAEGGVNLTKIMSRPIPGRPWEYTFYLDLEGHREDPKVSIALEELEGASLYVKILALILEPPAITRWMPLRGPSQNRPSQGKILILLRILYLTCGGSRGAKGGRLRRKLCRDKGT